MSQHDYVIGNDTAANVRADINTALLAIASNNSGASAPATTYANQWWYDSTNDILKIRAEANDAWISVAKLNQTLDQFFPIVGGVEVTATGTEINILAGAVLSTTELNYVDGVTSAIQTQLNAKVSAASPTFTGTVGIPAATVADSVTTTADNDGTISSGTYTPTPSGGNMKYIVNNGAFTFAAPTASGDYTLVVQMTNSASAGTVTFSGFNKTSGAALTTTSGDDFLFNIVKINGFTYLNAASLQ